MWFGYKLSEILGSLSATFFKVSGQYFSLFRGSEGYVLSIWELVGKKLFSKIFSVSMKKEILNRWYQEILFCLFLLLYYLLFYTY